MENMKMKQFVENVERIAKEKGISKQQACTILGKHHSNYYTYKRVLAGKPARRQQQDELLMPSKDAKPDKRASRGQGQVTITKTHLVNIPVEQPGERVCVLIGDSRTIGRYLDQVDAFWGSR